MTQSENVSGNDLLDAIAGIEFEVSLGVGGSNRLAKRALAGRREVQALKEGLFVGPVSESTVRGFVKGIMGRFQPGVRLGDQTALAALAVAMERSPHPFAREYLSNLADLDVAELRMASGVARECLAVSTSQPRNEFRAFAMANSRTSPPMRAESFRESVIFDTTVAQSCAPHAAA